LLIANIAGELLPVAIGTLGCRGKISVVGREAGEVPLFNTGTLFFRRLRMGGVAVGAYTPAESRAAWASVVELMNRTGARPIVDSVHDFERLPEAFAQLKRGPMGKVLLRVGA
jgi:NADPH:quinone reductase